MRTSQGLTSPDARRWFGLAVGALAVSGALAAVLVTQRILAAWAIVPPGDQEFALRSLVVHVNLATGVWLFAFVVGLICLASKARIYSARLAAVATAGVVIFTLSAGISGADAVLSDYVPVIDHAIFLAGLAAFAGSVALVVLGDWLFSTSADSGALPPEVRCGVRASGLGFWIAMLTIAGAYLGRDATASPLATFQHLFWGGGHVLQFAATAAMLAGWLLLLHEVLGAGALGPRGAAWLFGVLLLPTTIGPWLAAFGHSPRTFTRMMEFGIAPAVIAVMIIGARALIRQRASGLARAPVQRVALTGLVASAAMTLLGFWFGAAISGNTTLTPAHYHVNIGAVTVTFMAVLLVLLPRFDVPVGWPRTAQWQPLVYGAGQTLFASGLAVAGFWGDAARKAYGAAPQVTPVVSRAGFLIAGIGGALALLGGVAFVALVARAWLQRPRRLADRSARVLPGSISRRTAE